MSDTLFHAVPTDLQWKLLGDFEVIFSSLSHDGVMWHYTRISFPLLETDSVFERSINANTENACNETSYKTMHNGANFERLISRMLSIISVLITRVLLQ